MKTETRTEFVVMGLKPDGEWRMLSRKFADAVSAQQHLGEYIKDTEQLPELYTAYPEYRIAKRTVQTIASDWEGV